MLMAACALRAPEPGDTIHVADIINSVKCGLAEAMRTDAGRRRLPGTIATVELQLKVADTRSASVNSPSVTGPVIFAWMGPSVLPTLSATTTQSFTVDTTINLTYKLDAPNTAACDAAGVDVTDKLGFARWLGDIVAGLSKVSPRGARGTLDRLTYDATFAVTRDAVAGASVKVVFVDVGANAGRGRSDTQRLKIVISGPSGLAATPESVSGMRGTPSGRIPSLSSSAPVSR